MRRRPEELDRFREKLHQQALETAEERIPVYLRAGLKGARLVLDVGCGSGAVTHDVATFAGGTVVGLDQQRELVAAAAKLLAGVHNVRLAHAKAERLPFRDSTFDAATCNLLLMWVEDPQRVVAEMARVTKPGGVVVASLEPDFGGKLHWPENPFVDPIFAGAAIRRRGGDPHVGRKLRSLFLRAGLETEVGLANRRIWSPQEDRASFERARGYYRHVLLDNGLTPEQVDAWEEEHRASLEASEEFNFFPQFYAIGRKPPSAAGRKT